MGSLQKSSYTIPLPNGAVVKNGIVTWTSQGKKRTGKLSGEDRVFCESEFWIAKYTDENGKVRTVSTKTKDRNAANRILAKLETEVERIRAGVATREELVSAVASKSPIAEILEKYRIKMIAERLSKSHIHGVFQQITDLFAVCQIGTLANIDRNKIEKWIATEVQSGIKTPRTINAYLISTKTFLNWCVENGYIASNPLKKIKKLNEEIGRKKHRRSLTEEELERLFDAARKRKYRKKNKAEEHILIYQLLVGTGLRSTELSLVTPSQFDFKRSRFTVLAATTKNKRPDVLPIRSELIGKLQKWIEERGIASNERIFTYDKNSIRRSFYADLAAAGIERKSPDGRSIDVHSLRRTFGTMLARAGVPLTTTQRLMRHSTPELTAKLYIDVEPIDMMQAVEKLPTFGGG